MSSWFLCTKTAHSGYQLATCRLSSQQTVLPNQRMFGQPLEMCSLAVQVCADQETRQLLRWWQAEDGVSAEGGLGDPPLLDLEIEAASAQLRLLRLMSEGTSEEEQERRAACGLEDRLFEACRANIERFEGPTAALEASGRSSNGSSIQVSSCAQSYTIMHTDAFSMR
jgi:hypothetical protein